MTDLKPNMDSMANSLGQINGITSNGVNEACRSFGDTNNRSMKTPISLLQEITTKCKMQAPVYELITTVGRIHEPLFVYKCALNQEFYIHGKGASKKKAKHAAALGVLNHLVAIYRGQNEHLAASLEKLILQLSDLDIDNLTNNVIDLSLTDPKNIKEEVSQQANERGYSETGSNPVGELIEIAQRCSIRPPDFEYGDEEGPPHDRNFTCIAKFADIEEAASGRSKKIAKRMAAIRLLKTVQNTESIQDLLRQYQQSHGSHGRSNGNSSASVSSYSLKPSANSRKSSATITNQLKASQNRWAKFLLDPSIEENEGTLSKTLLDNLALEENFTFKFHRPDPEQKPTLFFLTLNTNPVVVCIGNSLASACCQALYYLRITCKQ